MAVPGLGKIKDILRSLSSQVDNQVSQIRARREELEQQVHRLQNAPLPKEEARQRFDKLVQQCQAQILSTGGADFTRADPSSFSLDAGRILHGPHALVYGLVPDRIWPLIERQIDEYFKKHPPGLPSAERPARLAAVEAELSGVNAEERELLADLREQATRVQQSQADRTVAL